MVTEVRPGSAADQISIRPGDYIQLKDGEEGYVVDVELKYTVIKTIYNNITVIPNSNLIDASFKNFNLEESWMLLPIKIGVSYDSDLEKVEQVTLETATQVLQELDNEDEQKTKENVESFEPFLRYEKFDFYAINLIVYLKIYQYYDRFLITHKFIKEIHNNYRLANIKIAYPISDHLMLTKEQQKYL